MKIKKILIIVSAVLSFSSVHATNIDPTKATDAMAEAIARRLAGDGSLKIHALVVGKGGEGASLVGKTVSSAVVLRRGSVAREVVDGVRVALPVSKVSEEGVEFAPAAGKSVLVPGSYTPLPAPEKMPDAFLRYLECDKTPISILMRLIADQTGVNISSSDATAGKTVSIFLRNIAAQDAVEEICRATSLWYRYDTKGNVIRITTMEEYTESLTTFREETTETFTLLYPNVMEVASAIYSLYPDRTLLSLGEKEFEEDDEYDLSRRFRRFRVIEENGNSQFMEMQSPRTTSSGSRSGAGAFSFSRGDVLSRLSQWDALGSRRQRMADGRGLSASEAKLIDEALLGGDTNMWDTVKGRRLFGAANIFVSMSRKNNMLIVRTSDVKVMDEIRHLVKRLDVPTPMVLMEVKVLELDITDDFNASFEYSFNGRSKAVSGSKGENLFADIAQGASSAMDSFTPTFAFKTLSSDLITKIELMQKDGKVKTLATPTLLSANNEVSRIFDGKEYPIVTGWTVGETTSTQGVIENTEPTVEIERKDVGNMLLITPSINSDRTVTLRLLQENSSISPEKVSIPVTGGKGENKEIEYVVSRSLAGTFVAKDGMAVMAGGLINEVESERYFRTPILGSVPLLGWLFRGTEKVKRRTELVVLIRPCVIMTPYEGGKASQELLKALSAHPARDTRSSMMIHRDPESGALKERNLTDDAANLIK
jgi:general secretion pathway protein D